MRTLDLSQLNLDDATRQLLQRLLNHSETLEADLQELHEENQHLHDEIARLKGQKGKPHFKANRPMTDAPAAPPQTYKLLSTMQTKRKPTTTTVPRAECIKIDREQTVPLDRSQVPLIFNGRVTVGGLPLGIIMLRIGKVIFR